MGASEEGGRLRKEFESAVKGLTPFRIKILDHHLFIYPRDNKIIIGYEAYFDSELPVPIKENLLKNQEPMRARKAVYDKHGKLVLAPGEDYIEKSIGAFVKFDVLFEEHMEFPSREEYDDFITKIRELPAKEDPRPSSDFWIFNNDEGSYFVELPPLESILTRLEKQIPYTASLKVSMPTWMASSRDIEGFLEEGEFGMVTLVKKDIEVFDGSTYTVKRNVKPA